MKCVVFTRFHGVGFSRKTYSVLREAKLYCLSQIISFCLVYPASLML